MSLCTLTILSGCRPVLWVDWWTQQEEAIPPTKLLMVTRTFDSNNQAVIEALISDFSQLHSDISVRIEFLPAYEVSLRRILDDPEPPDVFLVDSFMLPELVQDNQIQSVEPQSNKRQTSRSTSGMGTLEEVLADIPVPILKMFTIDRQLQCIPHEFSTLALIYNVALFEQAEISVPDSAWAWQELQSAAERITADTNPYYTTFGMAVSADFSRWMPFLYQAGGGLFSGVDQQAGFNGPEALTALEFFLGLFQDGNAIQPDDLNSSWAGEAFGTERVGMIIEGSWVVPYLQKEYPNLTFGVAPLPRGPATRATVAFGNCYAINSESQSIDAANRLRDYLASTDVVIRLGPNSNLLPARISLQNDPVAAGFYSGLDHAIYWRFPVGFAKVIDAMNGSMKQALDAEVEPAEVLRVADVVAADSFGR